MDIRKDSFSNQLRQRLQKHSTSAAQARLFGNLAECNQIYNGCFTRCRQIEMKLNSEISESMLPRFEQIVEHLRNRQFHYDDESELIHPTSLERQIEHSYDDDTMVSVKRNRNLNDLSFTIKNLDFLLKELMELVEQLIAIGDRNTNQHIIENAAVYCLWVFYDVCLQGQNGQNIPVNLNIANFSAKYMHFEYIFALECPNGELFNRLFFISRSLFELMDPNFLRSIFYYSSTITKAKSDIEMHEPKYDWFSVFTKELLNMNDFVDPFTRSDSRPTSIPISDDDIRFIQDSRDDLTKLDSDYLNADFILQNYLYRGISLPTGQSPTASNMNLNNSNKGKECVKPLLGQVNLNKQNDLTPPLVNGKINAEDAMTDLSTELASFIFTYNSSHNDLYYLDHEELYNTILNWIIESKSDDTLSVELTNLLGEEYPDLITKIITHFKPSIVKSNLSAPQNGQLKVYTGSSRSTQHDSSMVKAERLWKAVCDAKGTGSNAIGPSIVVHTTKEKELKKEMRKIEKKVNKELNKVQKNNDTEINGQPLTLQDLEKMRERNLKATVRSVFEPVFQEQMRQYKPVEKFPFVYDLFQTIKTTASYIAECKLLLPVGFEKKEFRTHDEVIIPIISSTEETKTFLKTFHQIQIADTDDFVKLGFRGFNKLNLIQSTVFQTAYLSDNQNMLICAPTGAGKTNIAMLSILNILRSYSVDCTPNTIKHEQFKIIYIAPMKALCAEMTSTFGRRLEPFGVKVRELTGDMQLTNKEIMETHMLVVTPEKWDIVTRKSVGDVQLLDLVRLIIIDEVHLLQSDRGHVLETIVARTIRYVEQAQKCIRLVGLSATLPNYIDVAEFLHVDLYKGLFVFDERFRPVPLLKTFIGCKATNKTQMNVDMDDITFTKAKDILVREHQVMVFVHSRNATMQLANYLLERSQNTQPGEESLHVIFTADTSRLPGSDKLIARAKYRNLNKFLLNGLGVHHAGMPRPERNIVEKLFKSGVIKVLVCTSTLAWGVNLPAHSVIIRGTEYYDPSQGHFVDLDMLDVMQIFGRAGRPQFDHDGEATIITTHAKLPHYLSMLTNQLPIESRFLKRLTDNLNAEIVLGTISNVAEAVEWLRYTYAYIRMHKNPLEYGLKQIASLDEGIIIDHLNSLVRKSAEQLDRAQMVRYNPSTEGLLDSTHLGRIASHFYIQHETIVHFNENLREAMDEGHILDMLSKAHEFEQLRVRDEELVELRNLESRWCQYHTKGDLANTHTKVNILMQAAISGANSECHSLTSDLMYILQNTSRLTRGLFEYVLKRGWPLLAERFLNVSLMFEKQMWFFHTPLRQFESELPFDVVKLNNISLYDLREMPTEEIGELIRHKKYAAIVKQKARTIPYVEIEASIKPITRTILTVYVDVKPDFIWDDKVHGKTAQVYWLWLTDMKHNHMYHAELGRFTKKQVVKGEVQHFIFTIPLLDAQYLQQQYLIHCCFEYWFGTNNEIPVSCNNLVLPDKYLPHTKLLDLMPLPVEALQNELYQSIYRFTHFNPIQTQIFHTLYYTDQNVLLGAPTGSGKTIAAEIALFRVLNTKPNAKVVYIAPLKALVRERVDDWKIKIEQKLGRRVVELTGDVTPDIGTINSADVIVTTPEKWDGVSRGWPSRKYVREVALVIIDEIHLLGEERGPVLEMIVSRTNFICRRTGDKIRIVGLSTAIANAQDLGLWLGINKVGLYNFSASVRPVPIEVHVSGFSGKHYCPRMASMNKPAYRSIKKYSPQKPVIIFVSSRRQTRLTALDLITLIASDDHSLGQQYLRMEQDELIPLLEGVNDQHLKHTLSFGIGMHHAGLREADRKLVEELFAEQKIQILITTATLAWGVNLPAHAVIIKGTEFFDGKKGRYVDFPITDVLQMIGRAGRPQFDTSAVAILFVHDIKKEYYKKFLYEPFPVESHLLDVFPDHLNAEITSGTVQSKHEAMEYLSSTYLYYRIIKNPSYYGVDLSEFSSTPDILHSELTINTQVIKFLSSFIDKCVQTLVENYCIRMVELRDDEEECNLIGTLSTESQLVATPLGKISSYYYLSYRTVRLFQDSLGPVKNVAGQLQLPYRTVQDILDLVTQAPEYEPLPVRHNEEFLNQELAQRCPVKLSRRAMDSPHTKANLLLQAHCSRLSLPIVDYYTDLKTVLDQVIRILQAMIDISALNGSLPTTLNIISLQQCIMQASWQHSSQLVTLVDTDHTPETYSDNPLNNISQFEKLLKGGDAMLSGLHQVPIELGLIPYLLHFLSQTTSNPQQALRSLLSPYSIHPKAIDGIYKALLQLPLIELEQISLVATDVDELSDDQSNNESSATVLMREHVINKDEIFKPVQQMNWIEVRADTEYLVQCRFRRKLLRGAERRRNLGQKAFAPRFPKPKSESWYLALGVQKDSELVTITRVANITTHSSHVTVQFRTPLECEQRVLYTLYLLSDCYIGLDQQYSLPLLLTSAS